MSFHSYMMALNAHGHFLFGYLALICCAVTMSGYLLVAKREIDVFSIAGASALLFTLPLLLGIGLSGPPGWPVVRPEPELYVVFACLYILILIFSFIYDSVEQYAVVPIRPMDSLYKTTMDISLILVWSSVLLILFSGHGAGLLFTQTKRELMDSSGLALVAFVWTSILVIVWFFYYGATLSKLFAVSVSVFCVFIGFRSPIVIAGLAILVLYGRDLGKVSLLLRFPIRLPVFALACLLIVSLSKPFYGYFKRGRLDAVIDAVSSRGLSDMALAGMEFMKTQYIFNEIVLRDFSTDGGHILRGPLSLLPIPRSLYTKPSSEFNDLFQPTLFPDLSYGMAYNPFGEFYAAGGLLAVFAFNLTFVVAIFILAILVRLGSVWSVVWSIFAVLVAFYFHRNSVAVTFGFFRAIFWPFLFAWLTSLLMVSSRKLFVVKHNRVSIW